MRSMRPLRPARTTPAATPSRARATATVAFGAALGMITIAGITAASAAADVGSSQADSAVTSPVPHPLWAPSRSTRSPPRRRATLDAARAAVTAAEQVSSDVAASGLDVGVATTTVDAAELQDRIKRLSPLEKLPLLFLPSLTNDAADETQRITAKTAELREHLDAAVAQKAAEEAAAQAQREAEAAAAAAAAAAEAAAAANTPDGARATARQLVAERGWGSDQFSCLDSLWNKESNWNYQASNGSSGAFGIPQSLPGSKMADRRRRLADQRRAPRSAGVWTTSRAPTAAPAPPGGTRRRPTGTERVAGGVVRPRRRLRRLRRLRPSRRRWIRLRTTTTRTRCSPTATRCPTRTMRR